MKFTRAQQEAAKQGKHYIAWSPFDVKHEVTVDHFKTGRVYVKTAEGIVALLNDVCSKKLVDGAYRSQ